MARYDYRCPSCGNQFEVEHPMSEHPEVTCPACGTVAQQVFGASSIVFKGSGFYNTDQRGKGGATDATSSPSNKEGSASTGESSKPSTDSGKSGGTSSSATSSTGTSEK